MTITHCSYFHLSLANTPCPSADPAWQNSPLSHRAHGRSTLYCVVIAVTDLSYFNKNPFLEDTHISVENSIIKHSVWNVSISLEHLKLALPSKQTYQVIAPKQLATVHLQHIFCPHCVAQTEEFCPQILVMHTYSTYFLI